MRKNFRFVREEFEIFPHRVLRKIFTSRKKKTIYENRFKKYAKGNKINFRKQVCNECKTTIKEKQR